MCDRAQDQTESGLSVIYGFVQFTDDIVLPAG